MKRHPIYSRFEVHFIQCPEVIGEDICGNEQILVSGFFPDVDEAFEPEKITCGEGHEIDFDSLSAFDQRRIEEKAQSHIGDSIASYCEQICEREDL